MSGSTSQDVRTSRRKPLKTQRVVMEVDGYTSGTEWNMSDIADAASTSASDWEPPQIHRDVIGSDRDDSKSSDDDKSVSAVELSKMSSWPPQRSSVGPAKQMPTRRGRPRKSYSNVADDSTSQLLPVNEYNVGPVLEKLLAMMQSMNMLLTALKTDLRCSDTPEAIGKKREAATMQLSRAFIAYHKSFTEIEQFTHNSGCNFGQFPPASVDGREKKRPLQSNVGRNGSVPAATSRGVRVKDTSVIELCDSDGEDGNVKSEEANPGESNVIEVCDSDDGVEAKRRCFDMPGAGETCTSSEVENTVELAAKPSLASESSESLVVCPSSPSSANLDIKNEVSGDMSTEMPASTESEIAEIDNAVELQLCHSDGEDGNVKSEEANPGESNDIVVCESDDGVEAKRRCFDTPGAGETCTSSEVENTVELAAKQSLASESSESLVVCPSSPSSANLDIKNEVSGDISTEMPASTKVDNTVELAAKQSLASESNESLVVCSSSSSNTYLDTGNDVSSSYVCIDSSNAELSDSTSALESDLM